MCLFCFAQYFNVGCLILIRFLKRKKVKSEFCYIEAKLANPCDLDRAEGEPEPHGL